MASCKNNKENVASMNSDLKIKLCNLVFLVGFLTSYLVGMDIEEKSANSKVILFKQLGQEEFSQKHLDSFLHIENSWPTPAYCKKNQPKESVLESVTCDFQYIGLKKRFRIAYGCPSTGAQKNLESVFLSTGCIF